MDRPSATVEYDSEKEDLKALGAILLTLVSGNQVISIDKEDLNLQSEASLRNVSDECKDLIYRLLLGSPGDRVTAAKCLNHPWLKLHFPIP